MFYFIGALREGDGDGDKESKREQERERESETEAERERVRGIKRARERVSDRKCDKN